jgi:hypothetical protein
LKTCSEDEVRQEGVATNVCISMYFRTEIKLTRRGEKEVKLFYTTSNRISVVIREGDLLKLGQDGPVLEEAV